MSGDRIAQRQRIVAVADKLYNAGKPRDAAGLLQSCVDLFEDSEKSTEEWGRFCGLYGAVLAESGNPKLAIQFFEAAQVVSSDNPDACATICFNLGNVYSYVDNGQAAYDYFTKALNAFKEGKHFRGQATVLLALANFFFKLGANERARDLLSDFEKLPASVFRDSSISWSYQMQLANVRVATNEPIAALKALQDALTAAERTGIPQYVAQAQAGIAQMRLQLGEAQGALDALRTAYEQARAETSPQYVSYAWQYATALEHAGLDEQALSIYFECLDEIDLVRTQLDLGERYRMMQTNARIASSAVDLLMKKNDHGRAFETSERAQGRSTLDLMFEHQLKRQGDRRIRAGRNGGVWLDSPTLSEIETGLIDQNVHLLKLYISSDRLFVWLLAPGSPLRAWDATPALKLLEPVTAALFGTDKRVPWADMEANLALFWKVLLPEEIREIFATQTGRLLILPHRQLYFTPFNAIPQANGSPLGATWEIAIAPCAGAYLQMDPRRDAAETRPIEYGPETALAIGGVAQQTLKIPLIPGQSEPATELFFPELTFTAPEAERAIELLGGKTLIASEATLAAVQAGIPGYRVLHFATHGYWNPAGGVSLLLLSDAPLGFLDVIQSQLQAELVVLSACQTGLGEPQPDSYTGIAHEFLIAGARSVLMTLWPIKDSATLFFMDKFYFALNEGHSPSQALMEAQRAVRESGDLSDSYNWAAFQLNGRPFIATAGKKFGGPVFRGKEVTVSAEPGQLIDLEHALD